MCPRSDTAYGKHNGNCDFGPHVRFAEERAWERRLNLSPRGTMAKMGLCTDMDICCAGGA